MYFANMYVLCPVCSKLFHVRPVTQGDVYRAEPKDIPCIFQVGCQEYCLLILSTLCVSHQI